MNQLKYSMASDHDALSDTSCVALRLLLQCVTCNICIGSLVSHRILLIITIVHPLKGIIAESINLVRLGMFCIVSPREGIILVLLSSVFTLLCRLTYAFFGLLLFILA